MRASEPHIINTPEQLDALLGEVAEASQKKEIPYLHPHYQTLIEASPFAILATSGSDGLDASPRGDAPGFVIVEDQHTLLLPERRGNNRGDSLRNLLIDSRVALLFLIPGVGETLRVNGRATISIEPELLARFVVENKPPKCVLIIKVDSVFFQCARAVLRSKLWQPVMANDRPNTPTAGTILAALTNHRIDATKYDLDLPDRQKNTLY